jgi:hypothetical protein
MDEWQQLAVRNCSTALVWLRRRRQAPTPAQRPAEGAGPGPESGWRGLHKGGAIILVCPRRSPVARGEATSSVAAEAQAARGSRPRCSPPGRPSRAASLRTWSGVAQAGKHRFELLSTLRAHTNAPYKTDSPWKTLGPFNRPGRDRIGDVLASSTLHEA